MRQCDFVVAVIVYLRWINLLGSVDIPLDVENKEFSYPNLIKC